MMLTSELLRGAARKKGLLYGFFMLNNAMTLEKGDWQKWYFLYAFGLRFAQDIYVLAINRNLRVLALKRGQGRRFKVRCIDLL
jgi:hypothetical protein